MNTASNNFFKVDLRKDLLRPWEDKDKKDKDKKRRKKRRKKRNQELSLIIEEII